MAKIKPGHYTIRDILAWADFDFHKKAAADYLNGEPDHRRVTVGGLSFGSVDEEVVVPHNAKEIEVRLDGKKAASLDVDNGAPAEEESADK